MKRILVFTFAALLAASISLTAAQEPNRTSSKKTNLEDVLWDVNQQWLCAGPYQKPYKDCVEFRSKYWVAQFFEIGRPGLAQNKPEMVATQTAAHPAPGVGPYPDAFKLMAVYGNFALATDHTAFKTVDATGHLVFSSSARVLRLFVQENGQWRPAAAALVPIVMPPGSVTPPPLSAQDWNDPREKESSWVELEKQLAAMDQKWLTAAMTKKLDDLGQLLTDQWFEILGWNPTAITNKAMTLDTLAKAERKPGEGVVADDFKLRAIYGDVALATDRRTRTWTDDTGKLVKTPHRSLLVFVRQNGEWRSAGAALVPIMAQ